MVDKFSDVACSIISCLVVGIFILFSVVAVVLVVVVVVVVVAMCDSYMRM